MKRVIHVVLIISTLLLLTSCSNKKDDLKPVSIGNLTFNYDASVWDYSKNTTGTSPLDFSDAKGNKISINVSQESTYQNALDMIHYFETIISTNDDFKVFKEPTEIDVNGTSWYEYGYSFNDGGTVRKVYNRYYGKYYNAASVSYTSTEKNYDAGYDKALKMMSEFKITDVKNDVNEAKAHKFLVGEWDVADKGYLVLYDDSTYEWYKDATKDKNNMHYGTYGCDVENATMELKEGDGIYLALFPKALVIDGVSEEPSSFKNDYIISFDKKGGEGYPMVNISSYLLYTLIKQ